MSLCTLTRLDAIPGRLPAWEMLHIVAEHVLTILFATEEVAALVIDNG